MKIALVSFSVKGGELVKKLMDILKEYGHDVTGGCSKEVLDVTHLDDNIKQYVAENFFQVGALIFVGATGIAVRLVAPHIVSKTTDCGVIVIDELGLNVIPLLSGHIGGANKLAQKIAKSIDANCIITTATDINNVFAVDVWAVDNNLHVVNAQEIKHISGAFLNGDKVGFASDFNIKIPDVFSTVHEKYGVYITKKEDVKPFEHTLVLCPKDYIVGMGCRKDVDEEIGEKFFLQTLNTLNIKPYMVKAIATIDIKKEERAIICLCNKYKMDLITYTAQELMAAKGEFSSSEFVLKNVGADNVCERSAFLASKGGSFVLNKTAKNGVTMAIAQIKDICYNKKENDI